MALKGEEEGKIILGAFSMVDYYFYFDRVNRVMKVYKEDCSLRSKQILLKRERILEETIFESKKSRNITYVIFGSTIIVSFFLIIRKRMRKSFN